MRQGLLFEARGVSKFFGDFAANDEVSLPVQPGEKHALLGENGAGKSTLVKMIYGVMQPSTGSFFWNGKQVRIGSPAAARAMGIGMVFQHFSVFDALTVAENIALALPRVNMSTLAKQIKEVSERYGLSLDPARPVHTLSVGEKQRVEIIRCLLQSPKLLIMDEPTSVLTPQEAESLFETLDRLAADGCAILYISHKLAEVVRLCDRATILRHGKVVATCDPKAETPQSMAEMMVGTEIAAVEKAPGKLDQVRLKVRALDLPAESETGVSLSGINFDVHGGEILGIAGIAGEGQTELMSALIGEAAVAHHSINIDGEPMGTGGPTARRLAGVALVPEERAGHAAVPEMTLAENMVLTHHRAEAIAPAGWINRTKAAEWVARTRAAFDVRAGATDPQAASLSGGNLQKFIVGREILREPGVLIVNQPTWGVDAGAASLIRRELIALSRRGAAVVVISQDLEEIFAISDDIAVMHRGRLSPCYEAGRLTPDMVGLLMAGERLPHGAAA